MLIEYVCLLKLESHNVRTSFIHALFTCPVPVRAVFFIIINILPLPTRCAGPAYEGKGEVARAQGMGLTHASRSGQFGLIAAANGRLAVGLPFSVAIRDIPLFIILNTT